MDDQAVIRTYGNTNLPEGTPDRPLVTFAVFAYNQEKYIREAVEGAFSQTYSPLEIILSDDCSSDSTFEIMKEMAARYDGPHDVKVRQSEVNLGTALHLQAVASQACGEVIIVAAGDDISVPKRAEKIAAAWADGPKIISCIHSGAIFFDDEKRDKISIKKPRMDSLTAISSRIDILFADKLPFLSPTCAYSKLLFRDFQPLLGGSIIEDGVMAARSLCSGALISIGDPLVKIRLQPETSGTGQNIAKTARWNGFVLSRLISYTNKLRDVSRSNLEFRDKLNLERMYRKKVSRLSKFIIEPCVQRGKFQKAAFLFKFVIFYPSSAKFTHRISDGLSIIGVEDSLFHRVGKALFKESSSL